MHDHLLFNKIADDYVEEGAEGEESEPEDSFADSPRLESKRDSELNLMQADSNEPSKLVSPKLSNKVESEKELAQSVDEIHSVKKLDSSQENPYNDQVNDLRARVNDELLYKIHHENHVTKFL